MSHKKLTILTIAALLIVVVVCLGYATNRGVEKIVRQQSNEQQILLTRQSAAGIEAFLDEKTVLIEVLATEVVNVPPENMTPYFMTVYNKSSGFSSIGFVNSDGVIVTGYPPEDAAIGLDLYATKRNAQFDRARESKETYTTRPVPLVQGGVGSNIGVPIYSGGEFKGVVFAVIEISTLSARFLADTVPKGHGHTYMITRSGRCLYDGTHRGIISEKYIGLLCENDSSFADVLRDQMSGDEGVGYYFDGDTGKQMVVTYTPVIWRGRVWSVATSVPASEAEALVRSVYQKQILFIILVIAIILAGSGSIILILSGWNKELEQEVEKKTDDLRRSNMELASANTKLRKLDRLKSEFVSMVSHELKTPLTAIKISMDVLKSLSDSETDAHTRDEMLQIIDRNIERQKRLVNDLLDISRIETGNLKLYLEPVDLYDIIRESSNSMKDLADRKGIPILMDLRGESPQITGDHGRLVQVFVNLIGNALKFMDGGEIRIQAQVVGGHPEIRVSDTGIGIPAEELDLIFDKFHQVDSGLTREVGGSGLGLAISRGIVEGHGGSIRAESEVGRGSTFVVVLPGGKVNA